MSTEHFKEILNITTQVLPFLMTAALFIGIAHSYRQTLSPLHAESAAELIKLSCNYLP